MAHRERAAFVCSHVFEDTRPVLLVAVEDGDLMLLCGDIHAKDEVFHVVGANHLVERDPTVAEALNLEDGWEAERSEVGGPWLRTPLAPE